MINNRIEFKLKYKKIIEKIENEEICENCMKKGYLRYEDLLTNKNIYYFKCKNWGLTNNLYEKIKRIKRK